ncbi:MAG: uracil phosphoribosyltransferase [Chloroflexi bacterium]|nr:uracil phosphoribosyltransferase [Chloroflexota bacterium]OJV97819.1 MAG: uracil phosphoribosyltransferase [Chloroflexi bacterium 54-19]
MDSQVGLSDADLKDFHVSKHPLILHKLSILRDVNTEPKRFREVVDEITSLLCYEATADLPLSTIRIKTPLAEIDSQDIATRIGLVPILRSGMGMVHAMLNMIPSAQVWHIGLYRDHRTLQPVTYYNKLPDQATVDMCLVLDPMLATGGSAVATIDILKHWGARQIKFMGLIAAPEGVRTLRQAHPDVPVYVASLDSHLNEHGYIVPGLGDAGDRQYGTI